MARTPSHLSSKGPIFIVGCPRSGTTILQAALVTGSEIFSFPETQLPYRFLHDIAWPPVAEVGAAGAPYRSMWANLNRLGLSRKNSGELLREAESIISGSELRHDFRRRVLLRNAISDYVRLVESYANGQVWLEKSPLNVLCVHYIKEAIPDSRFIHIVRNAADVVASIVEAAKTHPPFKRFSGTDGWILALELWKSCVSRTASVCSDCQHKVVDFDKFVEHTDQVMDNVGNYLQIPIRRESSEVDISRVARRQEYWKFERGRKIKKFESRATAVLGQDRVKFIRKHTQSLHADALAACATPC